MRQVIVDAPGVKKIGILNILSDDVNACAIARRSAQASFAHQQPAVRRLPPRGRTALLITVSFLAAAWASEIRASPEAQHAQSEVFASSLTASVPSGNGGNTGIRLAQTTGSDTEALRRALDQEHHRAEMLARWRNEAAEEKPAAERSAAELRKSLLREGAERLDRDLSGVRDDGEPRMLPSAKAVEEAKEPKQAADIGAAELRKSLQQERERATRLEQGLAAARREVETQTALLLKQVVGSGAVELRKSLQQERERAEQLAQSLASAKRDVETQTALAAKAKDEASRLNQVADSGAAELRKSLQQERERAEQLAQSLASAKRDVETQTALAAKAKDEAGRLNQVAESGAAELRRSLQQERERAEQLAQSLASAKRETQAALAAKAKDEAGRLKQVADSGAVELRKSLQQERERAEQLAQSLASAKRDVETQTALAVKAKDEAGRLKQVADSGAAELKQSLRQEHERADALANELSTARAKVDVYEAQSRKVGKQAEELKKAAAENGAVELRKSLQQERERAELLVQSLALAKRDVETQTALAELKKAAAENGAVELRKSLQQERERAEQLAQSLASAKRDVETQTALAAKAKDEASRLNQVADSGAAELKQSLRLEHERAEALAQELSTARATISAYEAQARRTSE